MAETRYVIRVTASEFERLLEAEQVCVGLNMHTTEIKFNEAQFGSVVKGIIGEKAFEQIPWGHIRPGVEVVNGPVADVDRVVSDVFQEYRADGWPLCPVCEEDELWCPGSTSFYNKYRRPPTVAECIHMGLVCYRCQNSFAEGKITSIEPWAEIEPGLFKVAVDPHLQTTMHGTWLAVLKIPNHARRAYGSFVFAEERTELGQRYFIIRGNR